MMYLMHNKIIFGVFVFAAVWTSMDAGQLVLNVESIVTRAAELDPLLNGGFEDSWEGGPAAVYDWQIFQNGYTRSSEVSHTGQWSIRLQNSRRNMFSGAYQRIDLNQDSMKPVFVGGWVKGQNIKMARGSWFGASIYVEVHFKDGSVGYWNSVPNAGTFDWRWTGFNTGAITHLQKPIDHIFIVPILGNATGVAYFDDITVIPIDPTTKSAVTFVFDDGESNTYTVARPILDTYGFDASVAIPTNEIDSEGSMSLAQISDLVASGWEVISHSKSHSDMTKQDKAVWQSELSDSKTILEVLGFSVNNFVLPFGAYNADIMAYGQNIYTSVRAFESGDNPQGAYPYEIKVRQVTNTTTASDVAAWVAEGKTNNRWEVIAFHRIASSGDDAYYTTPETLSAMMVVVADAGIPVVTYDAGLKAFAMSGGPTPVKP